MLCLVCTNQVIAFYLLRKSQMAESVNIQSIASVSPGYQFRSGISSATDGDALVLQLRDIDKERSINWNNLAKVERSGIKDDYFARKDDILFVCRGTNNYCVHIDILPTNLVVPNFFYIIRITDNRIRPEFLSWYLGTSPARKHLEMTRRGTNVSMIPREGLAALPVPLIPIAKQQAIADLGALILREEALSSTLATKKRQLIQGKIVTTHPLFRLH